jgi:DNA invertase Pin-like site-specific DNA recombinase
MGHMMLTVMAGRAELERNLIAERTDKGHLTAIR